jgi:Thymidylate synthase complementing protein
MEFARIENEICTVLIPVEEINPQIWATIAAMFSRSSDGVETIVEKVSADKAGKFLETTYVGYGHESIGDLVDVKIFVQNIPFPIAAMIEHHPYFRGQESSTRYINFATSKPCFGADATVYTQQIEQYLQAVEKVKEGLFKADIEWGGSNHAMQQRAVAARAFDICRGLLPLAATTNVAWFGSIRSIKAHLGWMQNFSWAKPYADNIAAALNILFEKSMGDIKPRELQWTADDDNYNIYGPLDFGSWRDLNRHRLGIHYFDWDEMSVLPFDGTFEGWYLDMLAAHDVVPDVGFRADWKQCLLGHRVDFTYSMHNDQYRYVVKLRSKPTVHPTLRAKIIESTGSWGTHYDVDYTLDPGPFGFFLTRGKDTILVNGREI